MLVTNSVYHYKLAYKGEYNDADKQCVLKWDDPRLNISWPIDQPILQEKEPLARSKFLLGAHYIQQPRVPGHFGCTRSGLKLPGTRRDGAPVPGN